jgi:D-tyrosyl-tRNA(Tyr) deacylase
MIVVVQRVLSASITIENAVTASIQNGYVVLVGIEEADGKDDVDWLASKIVNLRIFNDGDGVMNLSIKEVGGEAMIVSQFTLHASTRKGNRPSYIRAAKPLHAIPVYEAFISEVERLLGNEVKTGKFGADMKVSLVNDGPVTIIIDTKNKV